MRRIRTCCICRKRYVTASGSQTCPNCRINTVNANDKINQLSLHPDNNEKYIVHANPPQKKKKIEDNDNSTTNPAITTKSDDHIFMENKNANKTEKFLYENEKDEKKETVATTMNPAIILGDNQASMENDFTNQKNKKVDRIRDMYPKTDNSGVNNQAKGDRLMNENQENRNKETISYVEPSKQKRTNIIATNTIILHDDDDDDDDDIILLEYNLANHSYQEVYEQTNIIRQKQVCDDNEDLECRMENEIIESSEKTSPFASKDDTICFMCGKQFVGGMKSKIHHIKRCSKQHGISIKDIKNDCDDDDYFLDDTSTISNNSNNKDWHNPDLSKSTTQSTLNNYFIKSTKSIHQVLMAGAKRMAKTSAILLQKQQKQPTKRKTQWKRKRKNYTNSYSNQSKSCPFHKRVEGTNVIVDGFRYANKTLSTQYVLTHFHSDHYDGLTKSWNVGIIYCTLTTANLVHQKLGVDKQYLHPLPLHTSTLLESHDGNAITVTLYDANHCPGAAIFLFQINNNKKKILHVGDFRWDRQKMLKSFFQQYQPSTLIPLDTIYFDTTYCNAKYHDMPTQKEAIDATIQAVEQHLQQQRKQNKKTLFLFGSYTIGKERVYLAVAKRFQMKVYVDSTRYKTLECCACFWSELKNILTTNKRETCLWIIPNGHVNFQHIGTYLEKANNAKQAFDTPYSNVVGFRPTGWSFSPSKQAKIDSSSSILNVKSNADITVYGVPYSEHSSFKELVDCLYTLKPKQIIPTVNVSKSQEQIDLLLSAVQKNRK